MARAPEPGVKKGERKAPVLKKRRADKTEWKRFQYALGKVPEAKERYSMLKSRSLQTATKPSPRVRACQSYTCSVVVVHALAGYI